MGEFYPLGQTCTNCGKMLEARSVVSSGAVSIKGLLNLEYRHTDGTTECVIVKTPRAWDGWSATRAFEKSRAAAWAKEDAAIRQGDTE
jgi:hypothetical protein